MTLSVLPGSIRHSSVYNLTPLFQVVSVALKGYYDGSGSKEDKYLTLGGLAGTFDAWSEVETRWDNAVSKWQKADAVGAPKFATWHSRDAYSLNGEFRIRDGWSDAEVRQVVASILNNCLTPVCFHRQAEFCASTAIIDMADYRRACGDYADLRRTKPAEAILVDVVLSQALSLLPPTADGSWYEGTVELYFDNNEKFRGHIQRVYDQRRRLPVGKLIAGIHQTSATKSVAIQATDFVAWSTNRAYTRGDSFFHLMPRVMLGLRHKMIDYEEIVASYKRAVEASARASKGQSSSRPS